MTLCVSCRANNSSGDGDISATVIEEISEPDEIDLFIDILTPEEKIGQLIVCRLPWGTTAVDDKVRELAERIKPGGYVLFSENIKSIAQVRRLTADLQEISDIPLFIGIDEEGGRVSRLRRLYTERIPTALSIGQTGDVEQAYNMSRKIGERLVDLGINMNFAPIADIWSNPANSVIGDRAFARTAEEAAPMVAAAVRGYEDLGVVAVIKHFPGHGDTAEDSHSHIAIYNGDKEQFDSVESLPFKAGIVAGAEGVMVGHIATPHIKGCRWRVVGGSTGMAHPVCTETCHLHPATLSDYWMIDILRDEMGFEGLIITDALEMGAMATDFKADDVAIGTFLAGADILLIPIDPVATFETLLTAYQNEVFDDTRLNASLRRILLAKQKK